MRGMRFVRACTAGSVLVVAAVGGTLVVTGSASATAKIVTCTSLTGNLKMSPPAFSLGGCTGSTGGSGTAQGMTITWANGQATYLSTQAFSISGKPKRRNCASQADKYSVKAIVVADTTGSVKVGGKVAAEVCILNEAPATWSLAPGSVLILR